MKITTKLLLSFLFIAVFTSAISFLFSIKSISSRYEIVAKENIITLTQKSENVFYEYLGELLRKGLFLSEMNEIINNIKKPDNILTVIELKAFFLSSLNIKILNNKKDILISKNFSAKSNLTDREIKTNPVFSTEKDPFIRRSDIISVNGNISLMSICPIIDPDTFESQGNLILEMPVDSEFADQIRDKTKSEIVFISDSKKTGTTFLDSNGERFFPDLGDNLPTGPKKVTINASNFLMNFFPIKNSSGKKLGVAVVFLNIDDILIAKQLNIRSLIWVSVFVLLIVFIISFLLGKKLSAPILNLSKVAETISSGNFEISLKPESNDEIGSLTEMFNKMAESLKSQRESLDHMRLYLKNIIDSMPSILIGVDKNGIITQWNAEAEKRTSVSSENAIGRNLEDLFPQFEKDLKYFRLSIDEKKPKKIEKVPAKLKDDIRYTDIMIYPLVANGVEGAVIRMDDVTSRVRIENMMIQTEKMMSVGGLAAGMAHEINNPLGGILLGVQNILRRLSDELDSNVRIAEESGVDFEKMKVYLKRQKILDFLEIIHKSGERASNIVSNMLNFSRRSESKKASTNLVDIIEATIELARNDYDLKKKYDFRHMNIVFKHKNDLPPVPCIENEIQQVILNLLKNSVQAIFSSEKEINNPEIVITFEKEKDMAVIKISDNGPGMKEEVRKRVFEPFFTTKGIGDGTGLGLSVSYFIITSNHNGIIYVESELGKGTTFVIKLPYREQK